MMMSNRKIQVFSGISEMVLILLELTFGCHPEGGNNCQIKSNQPF